VSRGSDIENLTGFNVVRFYSPVFLGRVAMPDQWLLGCAAMYLLGGLGAIYVLITKLWCAGAILLGSPSACF
jgi:hypothetical protein